MVVDPGLAEGRSRLLLFAGILGLVAAAPLSSGRLAWGSLAVVVAAFALNTAGKFVHYRELSLPDRRRRLLVATWGLQSVLVVAFLAQYVALRYGGGEGNFFWSLAVGGIGFALLHRGAEKEFLDDLDRRDGDGNVG